MCGVGWHVLQLGSVHLCVIALQVKESTVNIEENGVRLELTLVDTPGFGDLVDNSLWCVHLSVHCQSSRCIVC